MFDEFFTMHKENTGYVVGMEVGQTKYEMRFFLLSLNGNHKSNYKLIFIHFFY